MWFKEKELKPELNYDDLISDIQDVVVQQYSQHGVELIKKTSTNGVIELRFNVGSRELLTMNLNRV
ncbi:hypothetical protein UA38_11440 [Photobacterium kishitanii]|uniref:Uncharacterized protein n=1 Tax=Photobacterium kishitanii TaxID=318456 RepID=A0AAX0YPP7_9GAMM|nr:hypothetical protein [Photobacterium kishitanii]KJG57180.1 hypothetical protein UA38_11440 [Photobacterium kishitanii]KJG60501.1 hypothetical protein UA42_15245 [Photobacterium kishitanii]KJG64799.1 hypothetical protein UA40_14960 [Photobacterium kishitanii]KJG68995.1 hypothetical protein UA41_14085 [Photobacterium kishitanii]PSV14329.1 hypothetical protein C0W59_15130 [Photobacterium kishitanii]